MSNRDHPFALEPRLRHLIDRRAHPEYVGQGGAHNRAIAEFCTQHKEILLAALAGFVAGGNETAYNHIVEELHIARKQREDAEKNADDSARLYAQWRSKAERLQCELDELKNAQGETP